MCTIQAAVDLQDLGTDFLIHESELGTLDLFYFRRLWTSLSATQYILDAGTIKWLKS